MLDEILRWLGAGNTLIRDMGPVITLALGMLAGYGITQWVKFPIYEHVSEKWAAWWTRAVSVASTFVVLWTISDLSVAVCAAVGLAQPLLYTVTMALVRHYWPWLEATRLVGSADPSDEALVAQARRQQDR